MKKVILLVNISISITLYFANCAEYSLVQKESVFSSSLDSNFCLTPPEQSARYSKISFVLDKSGSNGTTDPDKTRRYNAAVNFISLFRQHWLAKFYSRMIACNFFKKLSI